MRTICENMQCKFHMNNTMQSASDNFEKESIQLDVEEVMDLKADPEKYGGIYKELAEILGDAATIKIWKRFAGLNITFPQKLYSKEYRRRFIDENLATMKPRDMAKSLGLTERRVRQMISEIQKEKTGE